MDIRKIKKLIELLTESDLHSIEVKDGEQSVSITRSAPMSVAAQPMNFAPSDTSVVAAKKHQGSTEDAPMVGVFYTAPSPNEPNFVTKGQTVKAGDTLGIIEAMKIMNPLEATHSGVIEEILVQNGEVVEFGQPIIVYRSGS